MSKYDEMLAALNPVALKKQIVQWIREWFEENGNGCNAVVGISGGKDSSVVAALCVEALGRERVIGVLMPNGEQKDIEDSIALVEHLGIPFVCVNIADAYNGLVGEISIAAASARSLSRLFSPSEVKPFSDSIFRCQDDKSRREELINLSEQALINLAPRIRMATLYAISQTFNGRVANTCNLSEDWVGYSTRYGDSAGDFSPLSNLTTEEVVKIGLEYGLPEELVLKVPSDGLCGKTDEENLGFTYAQLNKYIRTGICENPELKNLIDQKHKKNMFKVLPMPAFNPHLPRIIEI